MKEKEWCRIILWILVVAIVIGGMVYLALTLRRQWIQAERNRKLQEYRDAKIAQYQQENDAYDDYEVEVAFLGDSLTDGYDLAKYYPQYVTANRGIGGDTTFDLENRLQISVYDLKPKVAVMLIGANNVDTMLENYEQILMGLQENLPDTKVVLLSMTAMGGENWGCHNQQAVRNNAAIKLLAEKYGFTYIDLYAPLYDVSTGEVSDGYTSDGIHLTHGGYTVITNEITPVLQELLGK